MRKKSDESRTWHSRSSFAGLMCRPHVSAAYTAHCSKQLLRGSRAACGDACATAKPAPSATTKSCSKRSDGAMLASSSSAVSLQDIRYGFRLVRVSSVPVFPPRSWHDWTVNFWHSGPIRLSSDLTDDAAA